MIPDPCAAVLAKLDQWLDGELDSATAATVATHLEECLNCSSHASARKAVRARLAEAVRAAQVSAALEARIRRELHTPRRGFAMRTWLPVAAAIAVTVSAGVWYRGATAFNPDDKAAEAGAIHDADQQAAAIVRVGLDDHIHCAVYRQYSDDTESTEHMLQSLGAAYADLLDLAKHTQPEGLRLNTAHFCEYAGRHYLHIIFRANGKVGSLVISERRPTENLSATMQHANGFTSELYGARVERYHVAAFQTTGHLVYLITEGSEKGTEASLDSMTPGIRTVLARVES